MAKKGRKGGRPEKPRKPRNPKAELARATKEACMKIVKAMNVRNEKLISELGTYWHLEIEKLVRKFLPNGRASLVNLRTETDLAQARKLMSALREQEKYYHDVVALRAEIVRQYEKVLRSEGKKGRDVTMEVHRGWLEKDIEDLKRIVGRIVQLEGALAKLN